MHETKRSDKSRFFAKPKPKVLLTGANGLIGRIVGNALKEKYELILVDYHVGHDRFNRFGLEEVDHTLLEPPGSIILVDLASQREKFDKVLEDHKPDCVLHFAGILENQEPHIIETNNVINRNVLEACAAREIPTAFASSIMVMYGAAMTDDKVRASFERKPVSLSLEERHSVDTPLQNTPENIKRFNEVNLKQNFVYIQTKEFAEDKARALVSSNSKLTMVAIRIGWISVKNPYLLEDKDKPKYTEIPVSLDKADLQNFMTKLVHAILSSKISGYKCYICVSNHPSSWVNQENAKKELDWEPQVSIPEKYQPKVKSAGLIRARL